MKKPYWLGTGLQGLLIPDICLRVELELVSWADTVLIADVLV